MNDGINGRLEAYYEQGMEGRIIYAFLADNDLSPTNQMGALIFLEDGHELTILGEDSTILWSGTIKLVRRRWWDKHQLENPVWAFSKQKGVSYAQWMEWFWRKRPLRAILTPMTPDP